MTNVTDFHCHILPGIDDGSSSVEESIALLERQAAQGFQRVIATPHFYARHNTPERFLENRTRAYEKLMKAIEGRTDLPEILLGGEVHYFDGISDSDYVKGLTIAGKRCILIEMPFDVWTEAMYQDLEGIYSKQGITPVVAHMDRYIKPFATHHIPERLKELPVVVQANASFFHNLSTRSMALKYLRNDYIQILGSDCHNLTKRPPRLGEAIQIIRKHRLEKCLDRIAETEDMLLSPTNSL